MLHKTLTAFLRAFSLISLSAIGVGCASSLRIPEPEYHGTIQVMNQEFPVNVDTCGDAWLMVTTQNLYNVVGHGIPSPLYRGVQNVPDALIARRGDTVYATSAKEGILMSDNAGRTFRVLPGTEGIGKMRSVTSLGSEIVTVDQRGTMKITERRSAWREIRGVANALAVFELGGRLLAINEAGVVFDGDGSGTWSPVATIITPTSENFDWSVYQDTAMIVSEASLYRITASGTSLRIDSARLPQGGWRQISCYRNDVTLMRGRNEIWWGTFEEPLQVRIPMEGQFDQRVVSMELSSIGLVAGQRGTDHSLWLFIKNATTWEPLRTPDGLPVTEVLWVQRADTSIHIGTREGGLYTLDDQRFAVQKIAGNGPLMNIVRHVGSGSRSAITLIDGTILRLDQCGGSPRPINPPIPFRNGLQAMCWQDRLYVHDAVDGLFASADDTKTWERIALPKEISNLEGVFEDDGRIYAYAHMGLWTTSNDGASWTRAVAASDTVFAVRSSGRDLLIFTTNGWSFVDDGEVTEQLSLPTDVRGSRSLNYEVAGDIVAVFTEKILYVSNDRGERWVEYAIAKESPFTEVRIVNDRMFGFVPQTGMLMFDVYSDRPARP
jgi:hypothetical protein